MPELKYIYTVTTENNSKVAFNLVEEAAEHIKQTIISEAEWLQAIDGRTFTVEKIEIGTNKPAKKPRKRA